ncbi:MAG: YdcF family protein [Nitrospiraceae bacterium]|nr:MAG: YdcF family protein [Nitrospiraceae bacterium]
MIPGSKLLLSGGSGINGDSSAEVMAQVATSIGIDEQDIIMEARSRDTRDEALVIQSMAVDERFILVTSALHMPRSMALFRKLGMNPVPAPAGFLSTETISRGPSRFFPSSVNLRKVEFAVHEYLGILWAKLQNQM